MDDKTFIAAYVAKEAQRINERLKHAVTSGQMPSDAEKDALISDIEMTLSRMQRALSQIKLEQERATDAKMS